MKFLVKSPGSQILKDGWTYKKGQPANNKQLKELLLDEQYQFCAYTEKYIQNLDSSEVEHFNSSKKYKIDLKEFYS